MQCVTAAQVVLLPRRGAGAMSWGSRILSCTRWGSCGSLAIGKTFVCLVPLCSARTMLPWALCQLRNTPCLPSDRGSLGQKPVFLTRKRKGQGGW